MTGGGGFQSRRLIGSNSTKIRRYSTPVELQVRYIRSSRNHLLATASSSSDMISCWFLRSLYSDVCTAGWDILISLWICRNIAFAQLLKLPFIDFLFSPSTFQLFLTLLTFPFRQVACIRYDCF